MVCSYVYNTKSFNPIGGISIYIYLYRKLYKGSNLYTSMEIRILVVKNDEDEEIHFKEIRTTEIVLGSFTKIDFSSIVHISALYGEPSEENSCVISYVYGGFGFIFNHESNMVYTYPSSLGDDK